MDRDTSAFASKALRAGLTVLALLTIWAGIKYLLPHMMPLIIAFLLAWLIEPAVCLLTTKLNIPRGISSAVISLALIGGIVFILTAIAGSAVRELRLLLKQVPELIETVSLQLMSLEPFLYRLHETMPVVSGFLISSVKSLPNQAAEIVGSLSSALISALSQSAAKAPSILMLFLSCSVGVYFISAEYSDILRFIKKQIPTAWRSKLRLIRDDLTHTVSAWLWARLLLAAITFAELTIAFSLLKLDYAVISAFIVSLLDVLPLIGTGTVLIPWSLYCLLLGDSALGLGLLLTYAILTLLNNILETQLVGSRIGLSPAAMLLSAYVGFIFLGAGGMIAAPIAAIMLKQMNDKGILKLWKS